MPNELTIVQRFGVLLLALLAACVFGAGDAMAQSASCSSLYRTLQTLAATDLIDTVRTDTGESMYRRCAASHHHHHLVCRKCGSAVEVSGRNIETWAAEVASRHGFSDVSHTIELFGTCADCS